VGEVDQLEDAVDERVAERDEREDGALRQPDDEDVEEIRRVLGEVDQQPDCDESNEREPENGRQTRARTIEQCREGRGRFSASLDRYG
jgi:hypothetical protein